LEVGYVTQFIERTATNLGIASGAKFLYDSTILCHEGKPGRLTDYDLG